jgi:catechol 2,3-dioxygenase-like lactoylglutathione lyase family enzyme
MPIHVRGLAPLLQVFDMPASIHFYRDTLGCLITETDGKPIPDNDWVLLELNGSQLMLNTAYEREHRPPRTDPARIAAHGDTCIYFGCPDVDRAYAHLRERGLDLRPPKVAWYGMKQLYLRDPDGFGICFQWKATKYEMEQARR